MLGQQLVRLDGQFVQALVGGFGRGDEPRQVLRVFINQCVDGGEVGLGVPLVLEDLGAELVELDQGRVGRLRVGLLLEDFAQAQEHEQAAQQGQADDECASDGGGVVEGHFGLKI